MTHDNDLAGFREGQLSYLIDHLGRMYPYADGTIEINSITVVHDDGFNGEWRVFWCFEPASGGCVHTSDFVTLKRFDHTDRLEDVKIGGEYAPYREGEEQ